MDDGTVRGWSKLYEEHGLTEAPRRAGMTGGWIKATHDVEYSPAGLIALWPRLGLEYRKPEAAPRSLDIAKQQASSELYDRQLRGLDNDEAVVFADAVHPTHQARAVGRWAEKGGNIVIDPSRGRPRLDVHCRVDRETRKTQMLDVAAAGALRAIALRVAFIAAYPALRVIHVFLRQSPQSLPLGSQSESRAGMAGPTRMPHQVHYVPAYCPLISVSNDQPDRTVTG